MLRRFTASEARCSVCGRFRTVTLQVAAGQWPDTSYRWSCWRPSHIRRAARMAEASAGRKTAFRERYGIPPATRRASAVPWPPQYVSELPESPG